MRGRDFDRTARIRSKLGSDNPEGAVTSFETRAWTIERPWQLRQAENFIDVEHFPSDVFPGFTSTTNLECSQCFVSLGINSTGVRLNRARKTIVSKRQQMAILNCSFNNHFEILKIRFIVLRNAHQKVMGFLNSHPTGHQIATARCARHAACGWCQA